MSIMRSVITVPKSFVNDIFSYFDNMPQRTNSPIRGRIMFIKYEISTLKKALIVDDSTTGGRKVLDIIDDLRKYNYEITDCLVVFVPIGKNVENKLKEKNVNLHKIIEIKTKIEE